MLGGSDSSATRIVAPALGAAAAPVRSTAESAPAPTDAAAPHRSRLRLVSRAARFEESTNHPPSRMASAVGRGTLLRTGRKVLPQATRVLCYRNVIAPAQVSTRGRPAAA